MEEGFGGGAPGPQRSKYFSAARWKDHSRVDIHTAAHGELHAGTRGYFLKDCSLYRRSMLEQVKWKKERRDELLWTEHNQFPILLHH